MASRPVTNSKHSGGESTAGLEKAAQSELVGTTQHLFFDDRDSVLCSSFQVTSPAEELPQVKSVFNCSREDALRSGIIVNGRRYEIHQYDPSLVYGRTMSGEPVHSEGIAVCKIDNGPTGIATYGAVTFVLPELTARQAPQLLAFCRSHLQSN